MELQVTVQVSIAVSSMHGCDDSAKPCLLITRSRYDLFSATLQDIKDVPHAQKTVCDLCKNRLDTPS